MPSNKNAIRRRAPSGAQLWSYDSIRTAINRGLVGDMSSISSLARSMMMDSSYSAAINKRISGLIRSQLTLEPCEEVPSQADAVVAEVINRSLFAILDEGELTRFLRSWLNLGIAVGQLTVTNVDGNWTPRFSYLSPEWLRWDAPREVWTYNTPDGVVDVTPGDGQWVMATSWSPGEPSGYVAQLGEIWAHKRYALRSWVDLVDNAGYPVTLCRTPANTDPAVSDAFVNDVGASREAKTIAVSEGYDVELLGSVSEVGYEGAKDIVEYVDRKYQVSILGGNLGSEMANGGSYAAAVTHEGVERALVDHDAQVMSTVIRDQVIKPMVEWNWPGASIPWPRWHTEDPSDLGELATSLNTFSAFVNAVSANPVYQIDNLSEIAERFGIILTRKPVL